LARRFDPFQREGLFRFLKFIEEQEAAEVRHEPAAVESENAVRLMTIHASKGLEFPVVVVAGLGNNFNLGDLREDILLDEDFGLCPKILPPGGRRRYPSIAHWAASQRGRRASLGEEMRLLYVAVTRARDRLVLVGTARKADEAERWAEILPVTDHALLKAGSFLDWLRLWFAQVGQKSFLRTNFLNPHDKIFATGKAVASAETKQPAPTAAQVAALKKNFAWRYPNMAATSEPAKTSVSALRRRTVEADDETDTRFAPPSREKFQRRTENELGAANIGTAHHKFLQLLALDRAATELDLRNQAEELRKAGALTAEEVTALDFGALTGFWQSPIGQQLRAQPKVHREMPFTARVSAKDFRELNLAAANAGLADDEFVVVQGVVDLAVLLEDEIWLLDFKTDAVDADGLAAKAKEYEPQLKLYALALKRIYNKPVSNCWLHFLSCGKTADVKV